VPDGALWELPFPALQSAAGRYLVEDTAVVLAPSLTAVAAWRARPSVVPGEMAAFLGVGEPQGLPAAARKTRAMAALYGPTSRTLLGVEATETRVKAEMGHARVLHFA